MMQKYSYIARNSVGRVVRGELTTPSPMDLRSRLNAMDLQLIGFDQLASGWGIDYLTHLSPNRWLPVRSRDVELALHQLAIMLRSGLKLLDAIKNLQMQCDRKRFAVILEAVHSAISKGASLSEALSQHAVFPPIVVQLVRVGEQTGNLDQVLEQSKAHMMHRRMMITEVRVALAYPLVVTLAALSIAIYLITAVIPQLQKFLSAMGRKLPAMTQSLVDLAHWFELNGGFVVVCICGMLAGLAVLTYWTPGRRWLDRVLLRLPIIGTVLQLSGTANLASSLAIMTQSGIRLVEAVKISTQMQRNHYLAMLLQRASESITRGHALAPSLAIPNSFTPILASMVEVAERAGQMDQTLAEVSKFCDAELKSKIKRMSQLVEPAVIVLAGGIVGYVYIAFFMALMSAGGNFK